MDWRDHLRVELPDEGAGRAQDEAYAQDWRAKAVAYGYTGFIVYFTDHASYVGHVYAGFIVYTTDHHDSTGFVDFTDHVYIANTVYLIGAFEFTGAIFYRGYSHER